MMLMQCEKCNSKNVVLFVSKRTDDDEEGTRELACRDCLWNSMGDTSLTEDIIKQTDEIEESNLSDTSFLNKIGGNRDWPWLVKEYEKELALIGQKGTIELHEVVAYTEDYMNKFPELGHAEALEVYFKKRAELAAIHPSKLIKGWFYGLPTMLVDYHGWRKKCRDILKNQGGDGHVSAIDENGKVNQVSATQAVFLALPNSLKRALTTRYASFKIMKPSLWEDEEEGTESLEMNATIYWASSLPKQLSDALFVIGKFKEYGRRFKISRPLAKALANTEPPADWETMVRLPYPITQIELPGPPPAFSWKTENGKSTFYADSIAYISYSADSKIKIDLTSKIAGMWGWLHFSDPGQTGGASHPFIKTLMRVIINSLLYINSHDANVVKIPAQNAPNKRPKTTIQKEKMDRLTKYAYYSVGPDITFKTNQSATGKSEVPSSDESHKHTYRYLVRGHYRKQPHGPSRKFVQILWIEPYWRGPDTGEVLARAYIVREGHRDERDWEK